MLVDDARYLTMQARDFIHHPGGRDYPCEVDFTWARDKDQVRLELRKQKLIEASQSAFGIAARAASYRAAV